MTTEHYESPHSPDELGHFVMRSEELGSQFVFCLHDHGAETEPGAALKDLGPHLPNPDSTVQMGKPEFLPKLKQSVQDVRLLVSFEFSEPL